ncbi:amino acid ABC transporter permease [Uliginosibacterium gangwonense]|uniref:amino acid ABC transporter permease n=1 Tax=Uliginosibacterium gangwonense TaxID=392736 RepID=UPI00037E71CC|nr:amino acid ABC transporter permease [Uliginosibacterium gangwonense]
MAIDNVIPASCSARIRWWAAPSPILLWFLALGAAWLLLYVFYAETITILINWLPLLGRGLLMNVLISVLAMAIGTVLGLVVGALELSPLGWVQSPARGYVQIFRNAPLLVLIFFTTYVFPFEVKIAGQYLPFPDWFKATIGLALPASAHIAEIFRGAVQSIPTPQWEASSSLAFTRSQTLRWIILPQCVKRALPPWMNLYAMITMSTTLASLVGVTELLEAAKNASNTVNRTDFTILVYLSVLSLFFVYCYPITRLTRRLEKRFAYH